MHMPGIIIYSSLLECTLKQSIAKYIHWRNCWLLATSKPVPIMLLILPISPSRISYNFYPLFLFYQHFLFLSYLNHKIMSICSLYLFIFQILCSSVFLVGSSTVYSTHITIHIHVSTFRIPFCCICNFSLTKSLPQIHWNFTILCKTCVLYRFVWLCWHYAQCLCHLLCS